MKILVMDVPASSGGALSILEDFVEFAKTYGTEHDWTFIVSTPRLEKAKNVEINNYEFIKKSWFHRAYWDNVMSLKEIKKISPDIIISLQNLPIRWNNIPQILYIHQPIPFQTNKCFSFFKKEEYILAIYQYILGFFIWQGIKKANKIVVQTNWMKDAIIKRYPLYVNRVSVVPPSIRIPYANKIKWKEEEPIKVREFFYPAAAIQYKNHKCIIEAIRLLKKNGENNFRVEFSIDKDGGVLEKNLFEDSSDLRDYIFFEGSWKRNEVYQKYRNQILIFPSYIETFGLPLLEARLSGGIIFASDCPFSREILFEYENAYFFDPFDSESLYNLLKKALQGNIYYHKSETNKKIKETSGWDKLLKETEELILKNRSKI